MYLTPRVTAPIYCPFIMPSETFTLMLYCSPHCAVNCTAVSHYIQQWCNPAIIVKTHCLLLGLHDTSPPLFSSVYPPRKSPMMHSPSFACVSLRPLCFLAFPCLMHIINQLVSGVLIIVQPRKISTKKKKRPSKQCGIGIVAESNSVWKLNYLSVVWSVETWPVYFLHFLILMFNSSIPSTLSK